MTLPAARCPPPAKAEKGVVKSKKALNHKDTKAQRKPFLSPGRSLSWPGKNFVSPCLCGSLLFRAFCDSLEGGDRAVIAYRDCAGPPKYPFSNALVVLLAGITIASLNPAFILAELDQG